jgi:hypothetical protein
MTATARAQPAARRPHPLLPRRGSEAADHQLQSQGRQRIILGAGSASGLTSPRRSGPQVVAEVLEAKKRLGRHRRALAEPDHAVTIAVIITVTSA